MTTSTYAVAPGEYLQEWIEDHSLTRQEVANRLGFDCEKLDGIIAGHVVLTTEIATSLENIVGIPARTWLRYEARYRADLAQ